MSADRAVMLLCGLCLASATSAGEDETPDVAFLEYLGMWDESDAEWLLHEEMQSVSLVLRRDLPQDDEEGPEEEESPEKDDES